MSFFDWLFNFGLISEDTWRDHWCKHKCDYCDKITNCRPYGAWAHQYAYYICKDCEKEKLK